MNNPDSPLWTAPIPPDWLTAMNTEGEYFDLEHVVPLDADSLIAHACASTGLADFGDDLWREPFAVLVKALEEEAKLTLMGRLMARSDIILWLSARLQLTDTFKQQPEVLAEEIKAPMIIAGLPRSGTSILLNAS